MRLEVEQWWQEPGVWKPRVWVTQLVKERMGQSIQLHTTKHGIDQNIGNRTLVALTIGYLESRPFFSNKLPVGLMQNNKDENLHIPIINFLQSLVSKFSQNLITYLHKKKFSQRTNVQFL